MVRRVVLLVGWLPLVLGAAVWGRGVEITIATPAESMEVPHRPEVAGFVSGSGETVWVIVHPLGRREFWVQPAAQARDGGRWSTVACVGGPGGMDAGRWFQVCAVVSPAAPLSEGRLLRGWPRADAHSRVVIVRRR